MAQDPGVRRLEWVKVGAQLFHGVALIVHAIVVAVAHFGD